MAEPLEYGAAAALVSLSVVQVMSMYRTAAPNITSLRNGSPADVGLQQQVTDADFYGGIVILLTGGVASILTHKWTPLLLGLLALGLMSGYHRTVLASPPPTPLAAPEDDYS